uniref:Heparanase n=1 Tax=Callithrix jacchus TaxID=9483 RepID=A0A8I3VW79_CALJA
MGDSAFPRLQTSVRRGTSLVYSAPRAASLRHRQSRCTSLRSRAGDPCGSSKPRLEGEPALFTLLRELPHRDAGDTAAPATRVALATRVVPPLGIFCSLSDQNLSENICKSGSIPPAVEKLQLEWPYQEQLLLREHYQKKFKNSTYSRSSVDMLYTFANCSGLDLIFGLNALLRTADLQWNSSNAQLLLDYCSSKRYNISWELGNEPNSFLKKADIFINGSQLGEDFIQLHKLLRKSTFKNAKLYGPDVGQPRRKTAKMLKSFLEAGGEVVDSVTWHHYYLNGRTATKEDFLNPEVVESTRPGKKVWLGETSSAYGGGAPLLSDTFAAGFMWLDKLGLSARMGIEVVMRQVFFGAGNYHLVDENFDPLPDYWLSLLFKKLVGTKVLMASVKGPTRGNLRVYLHCTNINNPRYKEGDLTLYAINLHNVTKYLRLPHPFFNKQVDKYLLRPLGPDGLLSKSVQLNGQTLKMVDDQTLPPLMEKTLRPGSSLGLPAFSYSFFVIRNAKVAACI